MSVCRMRTLLYGVEKRGSISAKACSVTETVFLTDLS